jgi:murein hydrolase activator
MKFVSNIVFFLFMLSVGTVSAQSTSEKLKKEQQQLESSIANTKQLLEKVKSNTENSFNELKLLNNQIVYREQLVRNYDNQIRGAELKIKEKQLQIEALSEEITTLKAQYKDLLLYAYKHRNKYGKMMYIFSSKSYFEAIKRAKYLEKIQEMIKKQFLVIEQHQKLIKEEMENIEKERQYKAKVLDEKKVEREQIVQDKQKQEILYQQLKSQEGEIMAKLREEERKKANLKAQIDAAIKKEIAEAEARRKKLEAEARKKAEAEAKKKAEAEAKKGADKTTTPSTTTPTKTDTPKETPKERPAAPVELPNTAEVALSKGFESNRGRLPWPVEKGNITEKYGNNPHPTIPGVVTHNNGVDISAPKNAQVRAVFEGEVTSVITIPGSGKVVIIKHGNYRTVYSNLQNVFVSEGTKVSTKQVIGALIANSNQSLSTSHFEIHQVSGSSVNSLNPSLWLAK